jgi:hypothetical protein
MGHSLGDGIIVASIAAAIVAYLYFGHVERRRRLEVVHQERLAAMDKGIPLPEFPLEPSRAPQPPNPKATLLHGIVWSVFGFGAMAALALLDVFPDAPALWPMPLPLAFLGVGLILYYALAAERAR